jgi:preprotein translocase subunit SecD
VLLKPEEKITDDVIDSLITSLKQRLNVYGLSDLNVRKSSDLSGNQFIVVEVAGANEQEVKDLLSTQGKFEAKIGNKTVFKGGNDITYVCRTADCSGIDPNTGCGQNTDGSISCRFRFSISLSGDAAQRQADITSSLAVVPGTGSQAYLNESLDLFLDDKFVQTLNIGSDLKGRAVTDIEISGSGSGRDQSEAVAGALSEMKSLQTILITGSLPVKLAIVKTDSISPSLGQEFTRNAVLVGILSILAVSLVVYIRYRKIVLVLPILIMGWIEIFLTVAYAALIGWNLDVPSIAGIIIAIGTGINDQILITDETIRGEKESTTAYTLKDKIKRAFFIVLASYFTSVASLGPLLFAGAGLLKGFAITSLIGLTLGVLITRPAYAHIIEVLLED